MGSKGVNSREREAGCKDKGLGHRAGGMLRTELWGVEGNVLKEEEELATGARRGLDPSRNVQA